MIKQQILAYLQSHPEGVDDDELARILGLSARQQANLRCRAMEKEGLVIRRQRNGKIHNFLATTSLPLGRENENAPQIDGPKFDYWFWEGNVQLRVVHYLKSLGFQILSEANTASHEQGIDVIAEKNGKKIWISVKGYPKGTDKTSPTTQAGHWFKQVIFDMIAYREKDNSVSLIVALPDFPRYRSMAKKITWFKPVANFTYFWVRENGEIIDE
jgi:hypothetical protein